MSTLKLLKYNNYFNRQVLFTDDYSSYVVAEYTNINFIPNDGVNTEQILNTSVSADYLLVYDNDTLTSRWFIIEAERTRGGQYRYVLHRDVMADNLYNVITAPCFVEKGMVDKSNDLIFNREGQGYNQIKTEETLLPDSSGCPWLVAYVARNSSETTGVPITSAVPDGTISLSASSIDGWEFGEYRNTDFLAQPTGTYEINASYFLWVIWQMNRDFKIASDGTVSTTGRTGIVADNLVLKDDLSAEESMAAIQTGVNTVGISNLNDALADVLGGHTLADTERLLSYDGKYVKFTDNNVYLIRVIPAGKSEDDDIAITSSQTTLFNLMQNVVYASDAFKSDKQTADDDDFKYSYTVQRYRIVATLQSELNEYMILSDTRQHTEDALYDIIAMPYGDLHVYSETGIDFTTNATHELAAINALFAELTSSVIYDVQLVPYCPLPSNITSDGFLIPKDESSMWRDGYEYQMSKLPNEDDGTIGDVDGSVIMFYIPKANFSFTISQTLGYETTKTSDAVIGTTKPSSLESNHSYIVTNFSTSVVIVDTYNGFETADGHVSVQIRDSATGAILESINSDSVSVARLSGATTSGTKTIQIGVIGGETRYITSDYLTENNQYITFTIDSGTIEYMGSPSYFLYFLYDYTPPTYDTTYDILDATDMKVENECTMYRLVSPNYNGQFEFNVAKNGGTVSNFKVDCTYKPFTPYIHVAPNWSRLYGQDFNDSRGLICGGDFSISQINDSFSQYELQNKNYQNIFDRQIQNMDVNNKITNQETIASTIVGAFSGGATGAGVGALAGGGVGAAIGGITGTVTSAAGGVIDYQNQLKRQEEAKSFSTDMYNYNLQNIQALPYSLTKVSALTYNNKYFPFIEKYTASDVEKEALRNKITYEGMTIGVIGTLYDYSGGYVKGRLIRLSDITDDSQMAYAIYEEVNKGLYLEV